MRISTLILAITIYVASGYGEEIISAYTKSRIAGMEKHISISDSLEVKSGKTGSDILKCYILTEEDETIERLINAGIEINSVIGDIATAAIPAEEIETVANISGVKRIECGAPVSLSLDAARRETGADYVQSGTGLNMGYDGSGVVIGIIDSGLEYDHINFYDEKGNLRIKRVWNQQDNSGTPPDGYTYGSEYTTQDEIEGVKYDTSTGTHATHVTGIAAGGYKGSEYYGVAPDADIVFVAFGNEMTSVTDGISYIYSYAESLGKPAVINLSLGSFTGSRDGTSFFDRTADMLQGEGYLLVGSAGNSGDTKMHMSGSFSSQTDTVKSFLNGEYTLSSTDYIEAYGDVNSYLTVKVAIYDLANDREIVSSPAISTRRYSEYQLASVEGITGEINIYTETEYFSSRPHVFIEKNIRSVSPGYAVALKFSGAPGKSVNAWDYLENFTSNGKTGWVEGDNTSTVGEIGGTGKRIITVGAYCTKLFSTGAQLNRISESSSRGPTLDGRMKPDITAPGNIVVSSYSDSPNIVNSSYYAPYLQAGAEYTVNGRKYYYGAMSGTSMSAPVVTGALALWLQARPDLTPEEAKAIIAETARKDEYTGDTDLTGNIWGYGKIDVLNGIKSCLLLNSSEGIQTDNAENIRLYYSRSDETLHLLFLNDMKESALTIYNACGQVVMERHYGESAPGDEYAEILSSLPKGTYIVKCRATTQQVQTKIIR